MISTVRPTIIPSIDDLRVNDHHEDSWTSFSGIRGPNTFAKAGVNLTLADNWVTYQSYGGNRAISWYRHPSNGRYLKFNPYPMEYGAISGCGYA
ncbi:hypothetical protein [Actinoplanes utahensis]|uniref:Uncharacterized protein n=1 Tax=Actinoplanes utahensis TaxID=1869 RepID=A0A0A6UTH9_ACTUT|nr:hypothetical protein [Actinoplanes utahensis]KHD78701.1 hypothetical protein MB27_03465 [Actinoplanes utahensis]